MATVTWNASKDQVTAQGSYGSGIDIHMPVGYMSWLPGWARGYVGFSYSFTGFTAVTDAVLHIMSDDGYHGSHGASPTLYIDLVTGSWSEAGGSGETWTSSGYIAPAVSTTHRVTTTIGGANSTWYTVNITGLIQEAFSRGSFQGLRFISSNEGSSAERTGFWTTEKGSSYDAYIVVTYSTNTAPNAPTSPSPTGSVVLNTLTPTFTANFSDPDAGDTMSNAQVIVYADDGVTQVWDSGAFAASGASFSKVYSGPALTGNTYYQWKGRTADAAGAWGAYTALQRFKVNSVPNAPSLSLAQSPTTDIKTLTPTFYITHSDPDASDSLMYYYRLYVWDANWVGVWDTGQVAVSPTATAAVVYAGPALSWQSTYYWSAYTWDSNGATYGNWGSFPSFTTHTTGVPINLDPTGGITASSLTPTFTGSRATTDDLLTSAQIQVYENDGVTLKWDSTDSASGVTTSGFSRIYAGAALTSNNTYKWRARVTSSVGGQSAWSGLNSFVAPDTNTPSATAPVGSGVTPVTNLNFTFTRSTSFNIHQLTLYQSDGVTVVTTDTPVAYTATTSKTFVYSGTLAWNTTYKWKVRVSADGGTNWSPYTGLVTFTTDSAGVPTLNYPQANSWLGAPQVVDNYDNLTNITNGTSAATSLDTSNKQTGRASLKIALTSLAVATTSETYRTVTKDLSKYGGQTPIKIWVQASTLTNLSNIRVRFTFATVNDYAEYAITPGTTSWEQKTVTKGSPTATGGTVNWANITRIGIRVTSVTGAYTGNVFVDDLQFDATNPSFDGTTFNSEVISTYRIRVYSDPSGTTLIWDSGDTAGSGTTFSKLYAGSALVKGTTYYWQARYVKSTGPTGNYSGLIPFILNSDPAAPSAQTPSSGTVIADSLVPVYQSTFSDNDKATLGDTPSMYEVEVYRNSDSVLAHSLLKDTGLTGGTNSTYDGEAGQLKTTGAASPVAYETEYKYRARYRDSMGAVGAWSSYNVFKPSQSPVAAVTSPVNAGTVTSPAFNITWTHTSPGGKAQNSYQLQVIRVSDAVTLYDTGRVYSSTNTFAFPSGYLVNLTSYQVKLRTWDTDGLQSAVATNNFSSNWTAPDPIVNFIGTDNAGLSCVILKWEQSNLLGTSFRKYRIYRKRSTESTWSPLVDLTNQATVQYNDYMTANTVSYDYKITQFQIVPGDVDLESGDSDIATVELDTDSWYVVGADRAANHIFELPVASAPFTEPVQQEIFEPLGTNRKVIIRGKTLGAEGTLNVRWMDSERDTAVAQVEYLRSNSGPHLLKSPFGDLWQVEFGGPAKDYQGGGHVNVTLVWTEVK